MKSGGTFVISDSVFDNDLRDRPFLLIFQSVMLLRTKEGQTWRHADYGRVVCFVRVEPGPAPTYVKDGQQTRFYLRTGNTT